MATKKNKSTTKKETVEETITIDDLNNIWNVVDEMQENLRFINDKVKLISSRLGV